jgi:hypothetical protein
MIHPQMTFTCFKALFYGPAHGGSSDKFFQGGILGGIAQGEFHLAIRGSSHEKPAFFPRQVVSTFNNPEQTDIGVNRAFSALGQN